MGRWPTPPPDQDLGWCLDEGVTDAWGWWYNFQDAFSGTPCAPMCGAVQVAAAARHQIRRRARHQCRRHRATPRPTTHRPTPRPIAAGSPMPRPVFSPTPRPTPAPTPATSDAVEGSFTCAGITLADAEAHAPVYAAAVADIYNVDESKVIVTFAAFRRRLQSSGDIVVSYVIIYASAAAATAAANAASSHTASTFQSAVQSAASSKGVYSVFAATTVQTVATPATTTTTPPPSPLPPSSSGGGVAATTAASSSALSSSSSCSLSASLRTYTEEEERCGRRRSRPQRRHRRPRRPPGCRRCRAQCCGAADDVLGPLSGFWRRSAVAPPPLSMCLMPFAHSSRAARGAPGALQHEAATLLQRRGVKSPKAPGRRQATQGLPTGQVASLLDGHGHRPGARRGGQFQQFSKKGAFSKLCSARRRAALRPPRQAALQLSTSSPRR